MCYVWSICVHDRPAYRAWLDSVAAGFDDQDNAVAARRMKRVLATLDACRGPFLHYFGCSTNISGRYASNGCFYAQSTIYHVHNDAKESSFTFTAGALAAAPAGTDWTADQRIAYGMERGLALLAGLDDAALASHYVLNAKPLGVGFGKYEALWQDKTVQYELVRGYYNAARDGKAESYLASQIYERCGVEVTPQRAGNIASHYITPVAKDAGVPAWQQQSGVSHALRKGSLVVKEHGPDAVYEAACRLIDAGLVPFRGSGAHNRGPYSLTCLVPRVLKDFSSAEQAQFIERMHKIGKARTKAAKAEKERILAYGAKH